MGASQAWDFQRNTAAFGIWAFLMALIMRGIMSDGDLSLFKHRFWFEGHPDYLLKALWLAGLPLGFCVPTH